MRLKAFETKYKTYGEVEIKFGQYANGDIAIQVVDGRTLEPITTPTVNLEAYGMRPAEDHVFIADYSENEGVAQTLMDNGIIELFDERQRFQFGPYDASALHVKLSEDVLAVIEDEKRAAGVL